LRRPPRETVRRGGTEAEVRADLYVGRHVIAQPELEVGLRVGVPVIAADGEKHAEVRLGEKSPAHLKRNALGTRGRGQRGDLQREQASEAHHPSSLLPAGLNTQGKVTVTMPPPCGSGNFQRRIRESMHCSAF